MRIAIKCIFLLLTTLTFAKEPFYSFHPPKKWNLADPAALSPRVKVGFICNRKKSFTPSMNLAIEEVALPLKEYISKVKQIHLSDKKNRWRELGYLQTKSGKAHLSQIETKNSWGHVRLLQSILIKDGYAYILTGVALKDDFPEFHPEFLKSFRSLEIEKCVFCTLETQEKKEQLKAAISSLKETWAPSKDSLKGKPWKTFEAFLTNTFEEKGVYWQIATMQQVQEELIQKGQVDEASP